MTDRQAALAVVQQAYPACIDADDKLLDAIHAAILAEREACAKVAENYGVIGWLEYKDEWTVTIVHDTKSIIARAIRERVVTWA